ncbi:mitochondrial 54S ribosomal protein rml2 [Paramarasmius palmivorus]|uniref:Large ribosomal subunit protein uL2m n=1 Tax=Paramarasmius palmivorus TaxID=297713 RepID=A0AAW0CLR5_9AGAR
MFSPRSGTGLLRSLVSFPLSRPQNLSQLRIRACNYATEVQPVKSADTSFARTSELFKTYKPYTPGLRHLKRPLTPWLYEGKPVRLLTVPKRKKGGRNNTGRITVRHRGGGHKQRIRTVDFMRKEPGVHDVVRIEYDPGRSAHIALLKNRNPLAEGTKKWSYIIATEGMRAGDTVQSFRSGVPEGFVPGLKLDVKSKKKKANADGQSPVETSDLALGMFRALTLKSGNVLPLHLIPPGTIVHNIGLSPTGPAKLVRSAGSSATVMAHEASGKYSQVQLQSGEIRKILQDCCATIGQVGNYLWKNRSLGKAGRSRWLGRRPTVRGVAMNACDHPHGGGRGRSKSNKHPVSIWGWGTKGTRTRKPGPKGPKNSNKLVIRERPRGVEKRKGKA